MSKMWKKALLFGTLGFVLGLMIALFFVLTGDGGGPKTFLGAEGKWASALYFLYCGLMGAVNMGTVVVYDSERLSITAATVLHFLITQSSLFLLFFLLGLRLDDATYWIMTAGFVLTYFIIWLCIYSSYRRKIRQMNDDLQKWKSARRKDE